MKTREEVQGQARRQRRVDCACKTGLLSLAQQVFKNIPFLLQQHDIYIFFKLQKDIKRQNFSSPTVGSGSRGAAFPRPRVGIKAGSAPPNQTWREGREGERPPHSPAGTHALAPPGGQRCARSASPCSRGRGSAEGGRRGRERPRESRRLQVARKVPRGTPGAPGRRTAWSGVGSARRRGLVCVLGGGVRWEGGGGGGRWRRCWGLAARWSCGQAGLDLNPRCRRHLAAAGTLGAGGPAGRSSRCGDAAAWHWRSSRRRET